MICSKSLPVVLLFLYLEIGQTARWILDSQVTCYKQATGSTQEEGGLFWFIGRHDIKKKERRQTRKEKVLKKEALEVFESLPEGMREFLFELAREADSPEEFWRLTNVGDCPVCESEKTRDCEGTPLDDNTVGLCLECYKMWCLECDEIFKKGQTICEHWKVCDECKFYEEDLGCGVPTLECSIIEDWKANRK